MAKKNEGSTKASICQSNDHVYQAVVVSSKQVNNATGFDSSLRHVLFCTKCGTSKPLN